MTVTLLKRLATLVALVCLSATLATSPVGAQESRPGTEASLAGDQTPEQQINRLYGAVFARQPDAGGFAFWVNELTSGARNLQQIADAMVGVSPEFADTYGDLNNRDFVNRLYLNVQGRPGEDDPSGSDFWTNALDSGSLTRGGVVLGFSESVEYRVATGSNDPVGRLYCAFFLRNPDAGGAAFYQDQFLVAERSLTNIAQEFTQSPEFAATYGSLTDRQFVELIYKNVLGRNLPVTEVEGPAFWTGQLSTGARNRGEVMVEFSESTEYQARWTRDAPCPAAGSSVATAVDDSATVTFAGSVVINWAQNDTLPSGTTVAITTNGTNGTAVSSSPTTFTYTRNANDDTTDSFTYTLTSADGETSVGTVNITILAAGEDGIPTAVDDVVAAAAGSTTVIPWAANDITDPTVTVKTFTQPANGTVELVGNTFTYTPDAGFANNTDTFSYTLTDGGDPEEDTSTATVTVNVGGTDTGAAVADRYIVVADTAQDLDILANDNTSGLSLSDPGTASHGTVEIVGSTIRYTPDTGYTAARTGQGLVGDSFTYTLTDASGNTSTASVEVIVLAEPACEVFMNYPYQSTNGVGGDAANIELFFSSVGCVELYDQSSAFAVNWTNVTVDGAAVTTTSPDAGNVLRDLAPVGAAAADFDLTIAGTATFTVDGATAVTVEFQLRFFSTDSGASWVRDGSTFRGRGSDDVTITINPLAS